jgi:glycosyltransferase involved in cell wall biosynthesis
VAEVPDVSVVIPTRDRWPFLRIALQSALAQRDVSIEVVVVDDGSRDEVPASLAHLDERVRVLRSDNPRGPAAARNVGIRHARAAWIAFLDDDDLWSPEKLKRQLEIAQAAGASFAYSAAVYVTEALEVIEFVEAPSPEGLLDSLLPANVIPAGASNVIAQTELIRRSGGFDESLFQIEDWDLWIRLAQSARAAASPEPLVAYRAHPGNWVLRRDTAALDEVDRLAAKHAGLATREGVEIDRVLYTRWIAWLLRRQGRRLSAAAMYLRGALRYHSPGNLPRSLGALMGEPAMTLARAFRVASHKRAVRPAQADLSWLEQYR